jgi:hypothetical protein
MKSKNDYYYYYYYYYYHYYYYYLNVPEYSGAPHWPPL